MKEIKMYLSTQDGCNEKKSKKRYEYISTKEEVERVRETIS